MRVTPRASTCSGVRPLIAACVATGIKVGNIVTPSNRDDHVRDTLTNIGYMGGKTDEEAPYAIPVLLWYGILQ